MNKYIVGCIFISLLSFNVANATSVADNIKPVGNVNVAGQPSVTPTTASQLQQQAQATSQQAAASAEKVSATATTTDSTEGKKIYETKCAVCHASGVAGAPKLGDKAAWAPRIKSGMDTLMKNVINGINAMPPKGTCGACSKEQLQAAVDYMLAESK